MATPHSSAHFWDSHRGAADAELLASTRAGDLDAYAQLWERHHQAGIRTALSVTSRFEAEDLLAEAHAKILHAIGAGSGPRDHFRGYLDVTIRSVAVSWSRKFRDSPAAWPGEFESPPLDGSSVQNDEDEVLATFKGLPNRWQKVLWYREVEGLSNTEIGALMGISGSAVGALSMRARRGFRRAWSISPTRRLVVTKPLEPVAQGSDQARRSSSKNLVAR